MDVARGGKVANRITLFIADIFKAHNVHGTETATFSMDDWMERTIYS